MFVGYRVPVKSVLRKGENKLVVRFRSPIREAMPQWESNGFDYPADNDHYPQKLSILLVRHLIPMGGTGVSVW